MNHCLALITIFFLGQVISTHSFMPINHFKLCKDNCGIDKYTEQTPKLKKIIKDLLKKSEKIKNIIIYPEPDDKEDWESGEIPWEPKNETVVDTYEIKNTTTFSVLRDGKNTLSSYNLGMLFT